MEISQPDPSPALTCRFPTDLIMSSLCVWTTALPIILLMTSPTPVGCSPGFLSKGISLLAKNTSRELVWCDSTHNFFATLARAIHMSLEHWSRLLDVSIILLLSASMPGGPGPPLVRGEVFLMASASMHSYFILCMDCEGLFC